MLFLSASVIRPAAQAYRYPDGDYGTEGPGPLVTLLVLKGPSRLMVSGGCVVGLRMRFWLALTATIGVFRQARYEIAADGFKGGILVDLQRARVMLESGPWDRE